MEMPLAEIADRFTILKLKLKNIDSDKVTSKVKKNKLTLKKEFDFYDKVIEMHRKAGNDISYDIMKKLYKANANCWNMENHIRQNMPKASNLSIRELKVVGKSAVKLLIFNEERTAIKNEINEKYKKKTKIMQMPLAEVIDRYAILKLKRERVNNLTPHQALYEKPLLQKNLKLYKRAIDKFSREGEIKSDWIKKLYEVNAKCWDIESDLRQGKENILGLEKVGEIAMMLREVHKARIAIKNEIADQSKTGFKEVKIITN